MNSLTEKGHKAGCTCGFCKNKGSFGRKKVEGASGEADSKSSGKPADTAESRAAKIVKTLID